jgi:GMP synthase-like glutamine amidotransferase
MRPQILAFRLVPFEGLGRIGAVLAAHDFGVDYADLYAQDAPPVNPDRYDALIFMGGPMSVNDDLAYLRCEEEFIRDAIRRDVPMLGICLGSQLIAHALGAAVRRCPLKEIGWFEIKLTAAALEDPLFDGFTESETVFHWHGETFDLPEGAVLLASSERCRNQAYRLGDRVYGLQFHPEVTPAMIADWCCQDENCGDVKELDGPIDAMRNADRLEQIASSLFSVWSEIVRRRAIT